MFVQKRGNRGSEEVKFDKITARIGALCKGLHESVLPTHVAQLTIKNIYSGIKTEELDLMSSKVAESLKLSHPDYSKLAGRIMISNLHKTTPDSFSTCIKNIDRLVGTGSPAHCAFIAENADALDRMIIHENDYLFDYFGYKTLATSYLVKVSEVTGGQKSYTTIDRPQYMYMRVAVAIYMNSGGADVLENIKTCYEGLSYMKFIHASPTLFNACTKSQQLASCFLLGTEDSQVGIMRTLTNASYISKWAGGIGIWMHCIRPRGAKIRGTNGESSGLPKQLKIYNEAAVCWNQGGKRKGAFAIYLEPWHGDILHFLQLKLQQGAESERARDLFYALWIPDLFMERAGAATESKQMWSLFGSDLAPGLCDVYDGMDVCGDCGYCANPNYNKYFPMNGVSCTEHRWMNVDAFTQLYTKYEESGLACGRINARDIINAICNMQRESGNPYICYKDHVNRMSNQNNVDTIRSSNLCAEIMEVSTKDSYACCTLASINLQKFLVRSDNGYGIDHESLHATARLVARNLDIIVGENHYPVSECAVNSSNYRPIGIGVQGLADVFNIMRVPYISEVAARVDLEIAETIYHAALTESAARGLTHGSYTGFQGSPAARGDLHVDLWMRNQARIDGRDSGFDPRSSRYDWGELRKRVGKGLRNSLHIAYMPTVSTSQIMGNNESFEPFSANIYTKNTLAGKFTVANKHMITHLIELGIWNDSIKQRVINGDGSIQGISEIPAAVRDIYKTVWEIKQIDLMRRASRRSAFVDQSQSLNIHLRENSNNNLRGVLFEGWNLGLKTGSYYIRTRPAAKAIKNNMATSAGTGEATAQCDDEVCIMCAG